MNKNEAVLRFLMSCPFIQESPLFFNFAEEEDGNNHFVVERDEKLKDYIDGSALKEYTFTIFSYRTASHNRLIDDILTNENVDELAEIQTILDWIKAVSDDRDYVDYPNFGPEYYIESIIPTTDSPDLNGVDNSVDPPLARYGISVKVQYMDYTKAN